MRDLADVFSIHINSVNESIPPPATYDTVNWTKAVFSILICVVGIVGNLIALFVIVVLKEYKKSVTHWYVLQLAVADLLFLLTIPID